jgi:hypothetical protein
MIIYLCLMPCSSCKNLCIVVYHHYSFRQEPNLPPILYALLERLFYSTKSLFNSFFTVGSRAGCIFLRFCWMGLAFGFNGITCWIIFVSKVFRSLYDPVKICLHSLNNHTKAYLSQQGCIQSQDWCSKG